MNPINYVHWQDGEHWLGYLYDYPEHWTQGESFEDLLDHLQDLHAVLSQGLI